ncbi:MAG: hypothetical protein KAS91_00855 [Candidatus Pacebacteria bacterium]|nr:hypothetical protein [Candidatus Paceibacterota bacterium]
MTPINLIGILIWWAFRLAGILAFAMIVFAGFQYLTSGGNTAQQKDAQERIVSAIIGLILLFAFYIILYTINPDILKVSTIETTIPSGQAIIAKDTPATEETKLQQIENFVLIGANAELDNYNLIPLSNEFSDGAYIDKETADKLVNLAKKDLGNWTVTEACINISNGKCITTIDHESTCHSLGTCVDVGYGGDPGEIISKAFIDAANQTGFDVIDEYTNDTSLWCSSSGSGFHLESNKSNCTNDGCWFCN